MYTKQKQIALPNKSRAAMLLAAVSALSVMLTPKAFAQGFSTVWDPLTPRASAQMPMVPAPNGAIPPIGSGATPLPPPVGMVGPPTLIPSIPSIPANQIGSSFSGVGLPTALPMSLAPSSLPGGWAQSLFPFIPQQNSTPGPARTMLQNNNTSPNPAMMSAVMPVGGLPGTGGYYSTIPKLRRTQGLPALGTNGSYQYELRSRYALLGGGGNSQDIVTQFGPLAGLGQVNGIPTGVGYNKGIAGSNNDLFNKSIDLGGGMRMKMGNAKLSTGKTVQDLNGLSALYTSSAGSTVPVGGTNIGYAGLASSYVTTDYGQGARVAFPSAGQGINRTTDFGFHLMPQTAFNAHPNEPGHLAPQQAVLTNY